MNQGSFLDYKRQVYNPGSPYPNPKISPLKNLPIDQSPQSFNSVSVDPSNPLKVVFSSSSKRKLNSARQDCSSPESPTSPQKRIKMMKPEDVKVMNEQLLKQFEDSQKKMNDKLLDNINEKLTKQTSDL